MLQPAAQLQHLFHQVDGQGCELGVGLIGVLKLGDAARVAPLDKLSVVLVAVISVVFLGERLSGANWAGVAMIAVGAVLVAWRG